MTRDIRYIDEGFLIWIIPSTYRSYESLIWACITGFVIFTCCLLACSSMPVLTIRFSMHVYDSDSSIHLCMFLHATWHSSCHSLGSSDSSRLACLCLEVWSPWILPIADQNGTVKRGSSADRPKSFSFRPPLSSRVFLL